MSQGRFEDLSGAIFGKLTVLYRAADYVQPSGQHKRMWHCRCVCGNECDVRAADLKTGNTRSCGCFQQESRGKNNFDDLTGKTFGRLTVVSRLPNHITTSGQTKTKWRCKCSCGNECEVYASQLKNGKISCGCITKEEKEKRALAREVVNEERQKKKDTAKELVRKGIEVSDDIVVNEYINKYRKLIFENEKKEKKRKLQKQENKIKRQREYLSKNSLAIVHPDLACEWNYNKNGDLSPNDVSKCSNIKVWWKCSNGHEWQATVGSRVAGNGCPFCSNYKLWPGYNDVATLFPDLLSEWDYEKNAVLPSQVKAISSTVVWWKCPMGHSYDMRVNHRTGAQKCGCPYCCVPAKRILKGFNDLETQYPELAAEWHPTRNGSLTPDMVLCGSGKKVWWIGKCGHEFEQAIVNRVNGGNCPYCSHQKLLVGFNDLATTNPDILEEWDYDKNTKLPSEISVGAHYKAWWKCPFGHSYQAYPLNRCGVSHSGCPVCDKENHTSFPEQALFFYVKKAFPDAINTDRTTIGLELDIYIPSLKIAIEYDGKVWHNNNKREIKKNKACKDNDILLMRIREEGLALYEDCYCLVRDNIKSNQSLSESIRRVLYDIDKSIAVDVDVDRDSSLIYSSYINTRKSQNLKNRFPEIAAEWHPSKNGDITPEMVAPMTNKKVWWLGKCGHEWQMDVASRVGQQCGCPFCSGKRVLEGFNDLLTLYPTLCDNWDYEKNNSISLFPDKVTAHSDQVAFWKCVSCGYEWKSKIDKVTKSYIDSKRNGCRKCADAYIARLKHKAVRCIETGEVYESLKTAEQKTGISRTCIGNCCRGQQKTAGKYHWEYADNVS